MRWHSTGHPWIFRDDLVDVDPGRGFLVRAEEEAGRVLGLATYSPKSKIALRFVHRGADFEIADRESWLHGLLRAALERRAPLRASTNAIRVVSSEADGLPGLIVDRYDDVLVLQSMTPFVEEHLDHIVPGLVACCGARCVVARNDVKVRELEGLAQGVALLHGNRVESVEIEEHGLRHAVDPMRGQKTGYFLDQRPARRVVEAAARGRVLDLFCYSGAFGLHAARGGAESVIAVDSSERAIAQVEASAKRNELPQVVARRGKVASVLRELAAEGQSFDLIVLDPPAFAKGKRDVEAAHRGYVDLNRRALGLLAPGGTLVTCSCSGNMRPERFREVLGQAAARASARVLDRGRLGPALDHPVLLGFPEADYLKVHRLDLLP